MEENKPIQEPLEIEPPHEPLLNAHNPNPKKSRTPLFALIGIIFILLVAGLGIIFGKESKTPPKSQVVVKPTISPTPTVDSTTGLKSYTNTIYQFSFQYPANYTILVPAPIGNNHVPTLETSNNITVMNNTSEILNVLLLSYPNGTLDAIKKNPTQGGGAPVINMTDTTVGNIPAIEYSLNCTNLKGCFEGPIVHTIYNNIEYIFTLHNKSISDQILSTFKFTDQTQTLDIPDLYKGVEWDSPQNTTIATSHNGQVYQINGTIIYSKPVQKIPLEMLDYYKKQLADKGWTYDPNLIKEGGFSSGNGQDGWYKTGQYFYVGSKYSQNVFISYTTNVQPSITPTISCIPRPACLDATPRCLIAEPASGWCSQ